MIASQYVFTLADDYDMNIIRRRVAEKSAAFDALNDLILKAFLISERGKYNNTQNTYAPFYIWRTEKGLLDFLRDDKFKNVTQAFGWTQVKTWFALDFGFGNPAREAKYATQKTIHIAEHADLPQLVQHEMEFQHQALQFAGVHSRLVALNPTAWEFVRFTLWNDPPEVRESEKMDRYEVLHVSAPSK